MKIDFDQLEFSIIIEFIDYHTCHQLTLFCLFLIFPEFIYRGMLGQSQIEEGTSENYFQYDLIANFAQESSSAAQDERSNGVQCNSISLEESQEDHTDVSRSESRNSSIFVILVPQSLRFENSFTECSQSNNNSYVSNIIGPPPPYDLVCGGSNHIHRSTDSPSSLPPYLGNSFSFTSTYPELPPPYTTFDIDEPFSLRHSPTNHRANQDNRYDYEYNTQPDSQKHECNKYCQFLAVVFLVMTFLFVYGSNFNR
ncbi:hypothetical protein HHI36_014546 [Cryptolaemus montrouzieri]|uniref:Uncharacterized protein n=1 Tax=Cryptolaemus montrouzieri TaxID=559131 RepID=A0ABD2N312_9CUCU